MPNFEHERKFLVIDQSIVAEGGGATLAQGYLTCASGYSFRVRYQDGLASSHGDDLATSAASALAAESGFTITAKGPRKGASRPEEETAVTADMGHLLMQACGESLIEKIRHPIAGPDGQMWVVDVFQGLNEGLWLAELECPSPTGSFLKPAWCGEDVTEDERYYNDYLSRHPYTTWPSEG